MMQQARNKCHSPVTYCVSVLFARLVFQFKHRCRNALLDQNSHLHAHTFLFTCVVPVVECALARDLERVKFGASRTRFLSILQVAVTALSTKTKTNKCMLLYVCVYVCLKLQVALHASR